MKKITLMTLCFVLLFSFAMPFNTQAQSSGVDCGLPDSDAEVVAILGYSYDAYWWDHADLTVVVQAHPHATPEQLAAIHGAIATWSDVLQQCFGGLITLTDITGENAGARGEADIVVHFVPFALGFYAGGVAICTDHTCPNVIIRTNNPPGLGLGLAAGIILTPQELGWVTLHEVGHALGLEHATRQSDLWKTTDLMGYGWMAGYPFSQPVLSDCDLDALAFVFAWALEGVEPYPPAEGYLYSCSLD